MLVRGGGCPVRQQCSVWCRPPGPPHGPGRSAARRRPVWRVSAVAAVVCAAAMRAALCLSRLQSAVYGCQTGPLVSRSRTRTPGPVSRQELEVGFLMSNFHKRLMFY